MQYLKKMCILRQLKQGFSCDGQPISGLVKAEQYGKNIAVEISVLNLATLSFGEWYCIFADAKGRKKLLPLAEKRQFSFVDDLELSGGFLAVICHVGDNAQAVAVGISGTPPFTASELCSRTFQEQRAAAKPAAATASTPKTALETGATDDYNDEAMIEENYYQWEEKDERKHMGEVGGDAQGEGGTENEETREGAQTANDENGAGVRHAFTAKTDGYYQSIRSELNDLFARYPKDDTLCGAFVASEWVRVKGEQDNPQELVGVVFEQGLAKYICYAVPDDGRELPKEFQAHTFFVPASPLQGAKGFFVVFQSAATGELIEKHEA